MLGARTVAKSSVCHNYGIKYSGTQMQLVTVVEFECSGTVV